MMLEKGMQRYRNAKIYIIFYIKGYGALGREAGFKRL